MKFWVGDEILIKEGLIIDEDYDNWFFVEKMKEYEGKKAKVVRTTSDYKVAYLDVDGEEYGWTGSMVVMVNMAERTPLSYYSNEDLLEELRSRLKK